MSDLGCWNSSVVRIDKWPSSLAWWGKTIKIQSKESGFVNHNCFGLRAIDLYHCWKKHLFNSRWNGKQRNWGKDTKLYFKEQIEDLQK